MFIIHVLVFLDENKSRISLCLFLISSFKGLITSYTCCCYTGFLCLQILASLFEAGDLLLTFYYLQKEPKRLSNYNQGKRSFHSSFLNWALIVLEWQNGCFPWWLSISWLDVSLIAFGCSGMDAQVAYGFHHLRNEKPYLAQGPITNKVCLHFVFIYFLILLVGFWIS